MKVKTEDGGIKDVRIEHVTAENYICPEEEKGLYHVVIEVRKFNAETGERLSKPRVQKFGQKAFETKVRKNLIKQGYTLTILHTPENVAVAAEAPKAKKSIEEIVAEAVAKALAERDAQHKAEIEALKAEKKGKKGKKAEDAPAESAETSAESEENSAEA